MPLVNLSNLEQLAAVQLDEDGGRDPKKHTIPNCVQVSLIWAQEDGVQAHNILGARVSAGFTPTQTIANSILTALTTGATWTALALFMPASTGLSQIMLKDRRVLDQPFIPSSVAGAAGTSVSPALPNEVAMACTFRTALVGKGNRGRMYVPGWATNALGTGNVMAGPCVTALTNWIQTIATAFSAQGLTHALIQPHRLAYTSPKGTPHDERLAGTQDITSRTVRDNHWDSQRRRGLK